MLETTFANIELKNPFVLASGIMGVSKASMRIAVEHGAGAITIKSISKEPRKGHNCPVITTFSAGMMNAVGYSNPGLAEAKKEFKDLSYFEQKNTPVIASIIGTEPTDFKEMAKEISKLPFKAIEIPLSCPHTPGFGLLAGQGTPEMTLKITKAVKQNTKLPVFIKVSPSIPEIGEVAKAAEKGGADGITAVNTAGPGMQINIETGKPVLDFKVGGISGPALKPLAIRCVYDIYESVKIPIIGTGGILTGKDAIEMLMAGATCIGIGSGIYYRGIEIFTKLCNETEDFMVQNNYSSLSEIIGISHE